ncbi:MAG: hypothetical protein CVV64_17940 [Candidatus Wallbacteria bacterium HGW-Wallbacteria-1]|jgi:5'-nucleotidase|uniref:Multifunctional 2',3'-cyclic-nucleotide 2'-phosphodiesterase/5'-nucleotidase/3'-nucleotidase n=1 Tax=Candidatus Wallbacteria bacterium HGW-Wallbacteria-1 TaxID=2013854 RepID=A0A2N1PJV5_9BACT|nr:MAG: hypothetical protein CVV64_17940 [Candidatus Wallbacteria bacterium HGW-Wallbacteria-1]
MEAFQIMLLFHFRSFFSFSGFTLLLLWAFLACSSSGTGWSAVAEDDGFRPRAEIVIAHTNDTHSHLEPFKRRHSDREIGGIARRATLLKRLSAAYPNFMYLDSGDMIQGTLFFKFFSGEAEFKAAAACGLTAMAIGNHEFDAGQDVLARLLKNSPFKALSANIHFNTGARQDLNELISPFMIVERGGYKVGIVGLTTAELMSTTMASKLMGISVDDPSAALVKILPELMRQSDVVILLSHLGLEQDMEIANSFPDVNVIIGGHSHTFIHGGLTYRASSGSTVILQDGFWGSGLGFAKLGLSERASGISVEILDAGIIDVGPETEADAEVSALVEGYSRKFGKMVTVSVGKTDVFLDGERNRIRVEETNLGNLIADVMRSFAGTDIAFQNAGGIRASIRGPVVTVEDVLNVMPFGNQLVTIRLSGRDLLRLFEAVARAPRDGQFGGFLQVSGMKVVYRGAGVKSLTIGGKALDPEQEYTIATNDFLVLGGDGLTILKDNQWLRKTGFIISDLLMDHFRHNDSVSPVEEGRVIFEPDN